MASTKLAALGLVAGTTGLLLAMQALRPVSAETPRSDARVSVAEARQKAKMMHGIYASTLEVMHHYYFRTNRAILPARALEDVFADMENETKVKANWIAVNTKAMSVNHEPKSAFEKKAAAALAKGKGEFEVIEDGYYRRAGAIPLASSCVRCHIGLFSGASKSKAFAGLVISVPVTEKR